MTLFRSNVFLSLNGRQSYLFSMGIGCSRIDRFSSTSGLTSMMRIHPCQVVTFSPWMSSKTTPHQLTYLVLLVCLSFSFKDCLAPQSSKSLALECKNEKLMLMRIYQTSSKSWGLSRRSRWSQRPITSRMSIIWRFRILALSRSSSKCTGLPKLSPERPSMTFSPTIRMQTHSATSVPISLKERSLLRMEMTTMATTANSLTWFKFFLTSEQWMMKLPSTSPSAKALGELSRVDSLLIWSSLSSATVSSGNTRMSG